MREDFETVRRRGESDKQREKQSGKRELNLKLFRQYFISQYAIYRYEDTKSSAQTTGHCFSFKTNCGQQSVLESKTGCRSSLYESI